MKARAAYDIKAATYDAALELEDFNSARIDRWLAIVKAGTKGAVSLTGTWRGGGDVKNLKHRGSLDLARAGLVARGRSADHMRRAESITIGRRDSRRRICGFKPRTRPSRRMPNSRTGCWSWRTCVGWTARPRSPAAPRSCRCRRIFPSGATRWPMTRVRWRSPSSRKVLSLALLKDWLPAAAKLDPRSTGQAEAQGFRDLCRNRSSMPCWRPGICVRRNNRNCRRRI